MLALASVLFLSLSQAPSALTTVAEASGFKRTGRYDEVVRLCGDFQKRYPRQVRCVRFGTTPENRPMLALVASADGALTPEATRAKGRPVVLFQGGIHAAEIDGKDAGFWLLRDLLEGKALPGALAKVTAVFVPVLNIDGHERFGPNHRPNQIGPEESGWRVTAHNLNLNRDYLKAEAPEMQALLALLNRWDPIVYLDLHVTDGAKFQHDVAVMVEPKQMGPEAMRPLGQALQKELFARLAEQGHQPVWFYPSFEKDDDPSSGFRYGIAPPRFGNSYWQQRNRFGVLVETHSWKDYKARVKTTRDVVEGFLALAARDGKSWLTAAAQADQDDVATEEVPLAYEPTEARETLDFLGYAYVREASAVSGQSWIRYDDTKPEVWKIPLAPKIRPAFSVRMPRGGYLVPPAYAALVLPRLKAHGLAYTVLKAASATPREVEVFRASEAKVEARSYEGHQRLAVKGAWEQQQQPLAAGTLFVPSAQPRRRLVAHLFEPMAPDSLLSWGYFNAHFEQKEYIEDYVLEAFARELLERDPQVKTAFEEKLKSPEFEKSPEARLTFFYERHPAWDKDLRVYPIWRTEQAPEGSKGL